MSAADRPETHFARRRLIILGSHVIEKSKTPPSSRAALSAALRCMSCILQTRKASSHGGTQYSTLKCLLCCKNKVYCHNPGI